MTILVLDEREATIVTLAKNRRLAHQVLFDHRYQTPDFHGEIIDHLHSDNPAIVDEAFRGAAKSTLAEEAIVIRACLREFRHCLIAGASSDKAGERLHAVRRHFEQNDRIKELFGDLRGKPWGDERIELATGITIQALGRGQALRGTKTADTRPDFILVDDIEDKASMATPEGREKIQSWFFTDLLPAGDEPTMRVRMLCNNMGPGCLAERLTHPDSGFDVHVYPWVFRDAAGVDRAIWHERYPMETIEKKRRQLFSLGRAADYKMEYLCLSETPEEKPFKREMLRVEPTVRTWQAVYAAFDPARTVHAGSAQTGHACWSWIGNRLVFWEAWGRKLLPDEIITAIFDCNEVYHPAWIGVDEVGLNEFMLQPIRQEAVRRGVTVPIKALHPPKSKTERIRALQPFANAREMVFSQSLPELEHQLLAFPMGLRDVVDAAAYALVMRSGAPVYEDFAGQNVMEAMRPTGSAAPFLCLNGSPAATTGVLVTLHEGNMRVLADWVREGEPAGVVADIISAAQIEAGRAVKVVMPPRHWDTYHNCGLRQAVGRKTLEVRKGTPEAMGRDVIRAGLRRMSRGFPSLLVSSEATWTLNAFSGGYCRALVKGGGGLADFAEEGMYRLLMEGLESFCGLLAIISPDEAEAGRNYATSRDGRRYLSAMPGR